MTATTRIAVTSLLSLILCPSLGAAQTPISACQTIAASGSYVLTNDLTSVGDCLVVTASDVAIDLGGFTITGSGTDNGIVDDEDGSVAQTGISVRNGTIRNFENGINLAASLFTVAERLRVDGNSDFGLVTNVQAIVRNSFFTNNSNGLSVAAGSVVIGNTASGNAVGNGIGADACSYVADNLVRHNGNGIVIGEGSTAVGNVARNNGVGISVDCDISTFCPANGSSDLIGNTLRGNSIENLVTSSPAACRLVGNTIG